METNTTYRSSKCERYFDIIMDDYLECNKPLKEIGISLGISYVTISKFLKSHGIKINHTSHNKDFGLRNKKDEIIKVYGELKSLKKVSIIYNCSVPTIKTILNENGIIADGKPDYYSEKRTAASKKAMKELRERFNGMSGKDHPLWKGGLAKVNCDVCGKELERPVCATKEHEYFLCGAEKCRSAKSREIAIESNLGHISGSAHHNWKGGRTKITNNLTETNEYITWRKNIYERDEYTCRICGTKNPPFNAHHIKTLIKIITENNVNDIHDARNCSELWDIDNGVTLCIKCHEKQHGNRNLFGLGRYNKNE